MSKTSIPVSTVEVSKTSSVWATTPEGASAVVTRLIFMPAQQCPASHFEWWTTNPSNDPGQGTSWVLRTAYHLP